MPMILNKWILPVVLHSVIGTEYCTSEINIIIFTALENMDPVHNFDFCNAELQPLLDLKLSKPDLCKSKFFIQY